MALFDLVLGALFGVLMGCLVRGLVVEFSDEARDEAQRDFRSSTASPSGNAVAEKLNALKS